MTGKVAVVFGGANGIGRACVDALASKGALVVIADIDEAEGEARRNSLESEGHGAVYQHVDMLEKESILEALHATTRRLGRVDVVVNSAGFIAHDVDDAFERNIHMLLLSVHQSTEHAIPLMRDQGGGSIVNIASIAGITGSIGAPGYGPAKHGVVGLTKDNALRYARDGIRINAVCPGYVQTKQTARFAVDEEASDQLINETLRVPMRRWGQPEEIGRVVAFIASDEASFMTGSIVVVDGGLTAR